MGEVLGGLDLRFLMPIPRLGDYTLFPHPPTPDTVAELSPRTVPWCAITRIRSRAELHQQTGDDNSRTLVAVNTSPSWVYDVGLASSSMSSLRGTVSFPPNAPMDCVSGAALA